MTDAGLSSLGMPGCHGMPCPVISKSVFRYRKVPFYPTNIDNVSFYGKFIEVNFCVGCMVSQPNFLLQSSTTMSLINKIRLIR